jgi:hypothetical protein
MNLVVDQLKGVLSDSIAKFLKANIKLEDTDIKTIFGDGMDKVLYHDEGFLKDLSSKMSDVVMPAYMKELRYLKKVVSGVDNVTKMMKDLQDKLAAELNAVVPNPQNAADTTSQINKIVDGFVKKAKEIVETKIGLRELSPEELVKQTEILDTIEDEPFAKESEVPTKESAKESEVPTQTKESAKVPTKGPEVQTPTLTEAIVSNPTTPLVLKTPDDITNALLNNISQTIQKNVQKGGAVDKPIRRTPDITPQTDVFITEQKPLRIPKRNYIEYDGNVSQLINQIMREKVTEKLAQQTEVGQEIMNSKSYKDVVESLNKLFIMKPDIQTEAINNLIEIIKESNLPNSALKKILDQTTTQIKNLHKNRGGTRKKRLV